MKYISYPVLIVLVLLAAVEFWSAMTYAFGHFSIYKWSVCGICAYVLVNWLPFYRKNVEFYQKTVHELIHMIVSMLFLQKLHSFHVDENGGYIHRSGRFNLPDIFIGLAPYCFPVLTYVFLFLRLFSASRMSGVFDVLIGATLAFHISCFGTQTRLNQPDIQKQGCVRSLLFIIFFWLFNASVILLGIRKGMFKAMGYLFAEYWETIGDFFKMICNWF